MSKRLPKEPPFVPEPTLEELEALRIEGELFREERERSFEQWWPAIQESLHLGEGDCQDSNCTICSNYKSHLETRKIEVVPRSKAYIEAVETAFAMTGKDSK